MRAKVLISVYILIFSTLVQGASIRLNIGDEDIVALETSSVAVESSGTGMAAFSCEDVHWLGDTGQPRIPWKVVTVLLPPDADLSTVKCRLERPVLEAVEDTWQVEPMPAVATRDKDGREIVVWPEGKRIVNGRDADIYENDAFWPEGQVRLAGAGKLRKWRLAEVAIPLVRYNPVSGRLIQLAEAEVTVDFQRKARSREADRPDPLGRSRVQGKAVNFAQAVGDYDVAAVSVDSDSGGGGEGETSPNPSSTGYVIMTTSAIQNMSSRLAAFVAHKQSRGFNVQVVTESSWGGGTGDTAANNIRAWLAANYISQDILYVLLIGNPHPGTGEMAMKLCLSDQATDYFFAELTADWDKDGDGIFGETGGSAEAGDEFEKYFEVYTGRIPYYGSIADTDAILQKIINYENATDVDWRRNVILPMVPLDEVTQSYQLGEQIKNNILEPEAITSDRIYDRTYGVLPPPEYLRSEAYPATVWSRNQYGMNIWMTHGWSQGASGIISTGDVGNLDDFHPAATYQGSCTNAEPENSNNLCYALLKRGAIATIGATELSWYWVGETNFTNSSSIGGFGYQYARRLVERKSCGQAICDTKEALNPDILKNYYVMMLYGDPSVVVFGPSPDFTVSPTDMFYQIGPCKGPFNSMSRSYTLRNNSSNLVSWSGASTANWLSISSGGIIGPSGSVTVDALSDTGIYDWPVGKYCGELIFTDGSTATDHKREAILEIKQRSMVAHWKLDETSGTIASDSSGNGHDGKLEGGFSFDTASIQGKFGYALNFSGPNDVVDTGKMATELGLANNVAKSVTAWVLTRSFNDGGIYEMGQHSEGQDFSLRTRTSDDRWRIQYWGNSDIDFSYTSKNQWVHFAHVYDGDRARIYADGQLVVNQPRSLNTGDTKTFKIGRWDDHHFDGIIDDVRIYNYPLDSDEVLAVIDGGGAENPSPYDTEVDAPYCATLTWKPGLTATYHDVYFGTNEDAVANATHDSPQYLGRQVETFYVPAMAKNTQYFWRIDEVPYTQPPPPPPPPPPLGSSDVVVIEETTEAGIIAGEVWSFTTGEAMGTITREVWIGIGGNYVTDLTGHPRYPDSPDIREEITSLEGPVDWIDNYGTRIHGFLTPPETGIYTFWIASDDYSELWLSSDSNPANQIKIAEVIGYTGSRQWDKFAGQQSGPITLTAGQTYYIKALHKEGTGGDNIAVAWLLDGSCRGREVISGSYLSPYDTDSPTPNPMTWQIQPHPTSSTSISMTATTAVDQSGVEYYFTCVFGGGNNSGWQSSPVYVDTGLVPNTLYMYTVTARDRNPNQNMTAPSQTASARTTLPGDFEPDGDVDFDDYARFAFHWPTAAVAEDGDGSEADLDGDNDVDNRDLAILVGNWLGTVDQPLPLPGKASDPNPSDEAKDVSETADLSWTADVYATSHNVYFGTSDPPAFRGNQAATTFDPGTMTYSTVYYWRIDEVNSAGTTQGTVWSFTIHPMPPPP